MSTKGKIDREKRGPVTPEQFKQAKGLAAALAVDKAPHKSRQNLIDNYNQAGSNVRRQKAQRLLNNSQMGDFKVKPKTWFEMMRDYLKPYMPGDTLPTQYARTITNFANTYLLYWLLVEKDVDDILIKRVQKFIAHHPKVKQEIIAGLYSVKHQPAQVANIKTILHELTKRYKDANQNILSKNFNELLEAAVGDSTTVRSDHINLYKSFKPRTTIMQGGEKAQKQLKDQTKLMKKQYSAATKKKMSDAASNRQSQTTQKFRKGAGSGTTKRKPKAKTTDDVSEIL